MISLLRGKIYKAPLAFILKQAHRGLQSGGPKEGSTCALGFHCEAGRRTCADALGSQEDPGATVQPPKTSPCLKRREGMDFDVRQRRTPFPLETGAAKRCDGLFWRHQRDLVSKALWVTSKPSELESNAISALFRETVSRFLSSPLSRIGENHRKVRLSQIVNG